MSLSTRADLRLDVLRDRNALYRELSGGVIENVYTLKLTNKTKQDMEIRLDVSGLPGIRLDDDTESFTAPAGELTTFPARVHVDEDEVGGGGHTIQFTAESEAAAEVSASSQSRFFMPLD